MLTTLRAPEHRFDQAKPSQARGQPDVVAERLGHLEAFELEPIREGQVRGARLELRELVEGIVEDPECLRSAASRDDSLEHLPRPPVVLEVEEIGAEVDREHAARVGVVDAGTSELERAGGQAGEHARPGKHLP